MILLDQEAADRPERRTARVAMELAKYNIDIEGLNGLAHFLVGRIEEPLQRARECIVRLAKLLDVVVG